ncbi:RHS repeat-associated core domain-containing protein [Paenibacillus sp. LS1]|uniref:RHS repeat-associated core domain-containing protein n=1 Tax=Paenibacillus sp. LS1 TaxID=2992120 RepID=UPI00222EC682|nr:RHS repeat-associated core domain-containing protein [Paenibacillus sp. LS1]MCW3791433.1 RHS repeat-associated core domain-containing protein [Paenibacillus sp. LS1]
MYTYDAFGNMLSAREQLSNPFRYAGEMQDALTGHYYLRARFYKPLIARFTQEDTYRGDGLNLYAYVANNPIRYVDPSGYMCEDRGNVWKGSSETEAWITLKYKNEFPKREFERKAEALKLLGEQGLLVKAQNPVSRDRSVTTKYRQDMIKRIWAQYGNNNKIFADKLINRVTKQMQPDHVWELQLSGPDVPSNLKFLDTHTNWHIGTQQIRPQIRKLPVGTKIRIIIEWGD